MEETIKHLSVRNPVTKKEKTRKEKGKKEGEEGISPKIAEIKRKDKFYN